MERLFVGWLCALCCFRAVCAEAASTAFPLKKPDPNQAVTIPWDDLNERAAALAKQMMERPTVQARGPIDTFSCTPGQYYWLLDNPDRAVTAWRRLGAKCVSIERRGPAKFGYVDDVGSDVTWET